MYNLYILELIVVCFLCVSCNPGWGEDTSRDKYGGHFTTYNGPSSITLSKDNEQKAKVKWYKYLIENHRNEEDNKKALAEYQEQLLKEYQERVNEKLSFLREFYSDMYRLKDKEFSKKYRSHCESTLLGEINKVNVAEIQGKDYDSWFMFTDVQEHKSQDFRFTFLDKDPQKVNNNLLSYFIFGDSIPHKAPEFRYYERENNWYKVTMGENYVLVKLDKIKNSMKITGLINPTLPFIYRSKDDLMTLSEKNPSKNIYKYINDVIN